MTDRPHPYEARRASLATKHDKGRLVAPAMRDHLGLVVVEVPVDTDVLGTFSGEVARPGSQWETAVAKARLGMRQMGCSLGLASEGSIGPSDALPLVLADVELVVLVDDDLGTVIGEYEAEVAPPAITVDVRPEELSSVPFDRAGFPEHGLIVRPVGAWEPMVKGIHDVADLERAVVAAAAVSPEGVARVESDLRAHHHPRRQQVIRRAAERLAQRLAVRCPRCTAPGWGVTDRVLGAPCAGCGAPTIVPMADRWSCAVCAHQLDEPTAHHGGVDPGRCQWCNP